MIKESGAALSKLGIEAKRITKDEFLHVQRKLEPMLDKIGIGTKFKLGWTMGSAGSWDPRHPYYSDQSVKQDAGDIDVMVDADELMAAFPPQVKPYRNQPSPEKEYADKLKSSKEQLAAWLTKQGFPNTGAQLNMAVDGIQVDLIVKPHAGETIHGHQMDYTKDVGMKGSDLWLKIWPTLIKMNASPKTGKVSIGKDPKGEDISALQLSPDKGVVDRETGEVLIPWSKKDEIAQLMVGPGVTGRDISSISGLRAALQKFPDKWNAVKDFFPQQPAKVGTNEWFRNMLNRIS